MASKSEQFALVKLAVFASAGVDETANHHNAFAFVHSDTSVRASVGAVWGRCHLVGSTWSAPMIPGLCLGHSNARATSWKPWLRMYFLPSTLLEDDNNIHLAFVLVQSRPAAIEMKCLSRKGKAR